MSITLNAQLPVELLNSAVYTDPDAAHTYATTRRGKRTNLHVPACPTVSSQPTGEWSGSASEGDGGATSGRFWADCCMPHRVAHVTLPDGTKRYRPAGPIGSDDYEGRAVYAEWAVVRRSDSGPWQVLAWASDPDQADKLAGELDAPVLVHIGQGLIARSWLTGVDMLEERLQLHGITSTAVAFGEHSARLHFTVGKEPMIVTVTPGTTGLASFALLNVPSKASEETTIEQWDDADGLIERLLQLNKKRK
ncbi:hypothetical protein ACIBH1_45620 [Nonomuraea sp. NPDC050663]|uniref:hypothetical protein n=1 Tax=Nonomuraea sp. NPDC050663 TaxID=3364370 RepID=UPI00379D5C27